MKTIIIYLFSFIFLLSACTGDDDMICPDKNPEPCDSLIVFTPYFDTCFEMPEPFPLEIFDPEDFEFTIPSFDINNPFVLSYRFVPVSGMESHWIVDLCKGEKEKFFEGQIRGYGRPRLGPDNWVVYASDNQELIIQKINGDSLNHLAQGVKCSYPTWINEDQIICQAVFSNPTVSKTIILDLDGNITDTISPPVGMPIVLNSNIACYTGSSGDVKIGYLDIENNFQFVEVFALPAEAHFPRSIDWIDEEHIVWIDDIGLHKINIVTEEFTTLEVQCENRRIKFLSSSPEYDGTILLDQVNFWPVDDESMHIEDWIYKYNTNTGEQWLIELEP